ncbi:MAG: PASTA domain-containing protein [Bacteroidota bacterium]|nr:PASTA domain-containing protein [Bacteroidota bacterium]
MMKLFFEFLKSKLFLINLLIAAVLLVATFGFTYKWLGTYTKHGSSVSVPDVRGMQMDKLQSFLDNKNLRYQVADSTIFDMTKPPGTVIEQDPRPNEKVKEHRTIYLSITRSTPPGVKIPDLEDNSLRQAEAILRSYGLIRGELIYKPDLAKNAVLEMQIDGKKVEKGEEVTKGTVIDLVLGDGFGNTKVAVPLLFNLDLDEALFVLKASSLNVGAVVLDGTVKDSSRARVYKQSPVYESEKTISQGESVDIFLTQSQAVILMNDPDNKIENDEE